VTDLSFLTRLEAVIDARVDAPPEHSYTARLAAAGDLKAAQKLAEEGVETALAAVAEGRERLIAEAADLIYHLLVLLRLRQATLADVIAELERRHRS
jgi:phosphoribosyl-ATP pyrophosphohydrolase